VGKSLASVDEKISRLREELIGYGDRLRTSKNAGDRRDLRKRATEVVRRKRMHEVQRDQLSELQFNIDRASLGVESAKAIASTVAAIKAANRGLKTTIKKSKVDGLDYLVDDTSELMDDLIDEVLALNNIAASTIVDEAELEAELDMLERGTEEQEAKEAVAGPSRVREKTTEGAAVRPSPSSARLAHSIDRKRMDSAVIIQKQWRKYTSSKQPRASGRVALLVRALNSVPSKPLFPRNELKGAKKRTGSARDEVEGVERDGPSESVRAPPRAKSRRPSKSRLLTIEKKKKRKRPRRRKRKKTTEEQMRDLSVECVGLLTKMRGVPKHSPEWVLSKMEAKLISEELEHLYAKSIARRARAE